MSLGLRVYGGQQADESYRLKRVVWEITRRCNLACIHCGSSASESSATQGELTHEECMRVVDGLACLQAEHITLSGGEPFLCEFWKPIAQYANSRGIRVGFVSNGLLVTRQLAADLRSLPLMPEVGLSLDGASPQTHDRFRHRVGLFKQVVDAIDLLRTYRVPVTVVTTVQKENMDELRGLYELLLEHDIYAWQIQAAMPIGRLRQNPNLILDLGDLYRLAQIIAEFRARKQHFAIETGDNIGYFCSLETRLRESVWTGCSAGVSILGIRSNGDIVGCLSLQGADSEGNVRVTDLVDIWNSPDAFAYNRRFSVHNLAGNCRCCEFAQICKGGCCFLCFSYTGTYHNNPMCLRNAETSTESDFIVL